MKGSKIKMSKMSSLYFAVISVDRYKVLLLLIYAANYGVGDLSGDLSGLFSDLT